MRIDAVVLPEEGSQDQPDVTVDAVDGGHVQPWMLVYVEESDEVFVVTAVPVPFQRDGDGGRLERWVQIPLAGVEEPLEVAATESLDIVYGADLDQLHDLLDPDLYSDEEEGLAQNGMCHRIAHVDEEIVDGQTVEIPVYCGMPSDPNSIFRYCTRDDQVRREDSDRIVGRRFEPTYGLPAAP